MGLPGLWDELGDGEIVSIAKLSSDHFEKLGRPLRVAVDEAGWRFNKLNPYQVAMIKEKVPEANPVEKAIFFRIKTLLQFNVRLVFVFDGPRRPHKRNRPAGRVPWKDQELLKKTLDMLRVPHHRAPAEAEAECAALQMAGKVDAVWSEDGDTLMFGCTSLIRTYRTKTKDGRATKDNELGRLYRAEALLQKHHLCREGLVLFAVLAGGDYDTVGLLHCGPKLATKAATQSETLASSLCKTTSEHDLHTWTDQLRQFLIERRAGIEVPSGFPRCAILQKYRSPLVTETHKLIPMHFQWNAPFDEPRLRSYMFDHFNMRTRGCLRHFGPILLVQELASTTPGQESANDKLEIKLKPRRKKSTAKDDGDDDGEGAVLMRITFKTAAVTRLDLTRPPLDSAGNTEDWVTATKTGIMYGPEDRVEAEIPIAVLRRGLGPNFAGLEPEQRARRKRKAVAQDDTSLSKLHGSVHRTPDVSSTPAAKKRKLHLNHPRTRAPEPTGEQRSSTDLATTMMASSLDLPSPQTLRARRLAAVGGNHTGSQYTEKAAPFTKPGAQRVSAASINAPVFTAAAAATNVEIVVIDSDSDVDDNEGISARLAQRSAQRPSATVQDRIRSPPPKPARRLRLPEIASLGGNGQSIEVLDLIDI